MLGEKMFRCPRCRHTEVETVPNRLRCPKCGASIPRPERRGTDRPEESFSERRVPRFEL